MLKLNRRKFLLRSAVMFTASTFYSGRKNKISRTPGALKQGRSLQKIIIVGAGISGLVAAYELARVGHTVKVLEARNRIGGRILTLRGNFSDGNFVEAGAARIPPYHETTLAYIEHFGLGLTPFYPKEGFYITVKDGQRILVSAEDLHKRTPQARLLEWKKIDKGSDQLPAAFAKALSGKIRLGDAVNRIEQTSLGVRVSCQSGLQYHGDSVVCTVPLTVLGRISFDPPLSSKKKIALSGGYDYRPSIRMFVEFPERFWKRENLNGWGIFYDRPEELWQPTWDRPGKTGILHSYLKGETALAMDALNQKQRLPQLLRQWKEILPDVGNYKVNAISHSWIKDPWSMGGWAYPTKEQEKNLFNELSRKEGRIYFAGEHTSPVRGWIEGALNSGIIAAKKIHQSVNKK